MARNMITGKETQKKEKAVFGRAKSRHCFSGSARIVSGGGDYCRGGLYGNEPQRSEQTGEKAGGHSGADAAGNRSARRVRRAA